MQSILWSRMVLMALVLLVPATKGLPGQVVNGQKGARQLELLFFQPGGEKLSRPISLVVRIQTGQGGVGAVSAGGSRMSVKDGRHILNLTTGRELRVTLAIEGDTRRYGDTIAVFRVGEDVTAYPVFLSPVVDETSGGMGRFRPGTSDLDAGVSKEAKAAFETALSSAEQRRFGAALAEFTRALALAPRFPGALNQLGLLFHQNGRIEEAVAAFTQAVTMGDRTINPYLNLGVSLNRLGRYGESIAILTGLLEANPAVSRIRIPLAEALVQSQQWDAAVEMVQPAIADSQNLPEELQSESRYILARTMFREERYRATVRELTRALVTYARWTNAPEAWLLLGISHYELKQDQEAERALLKALESDAKRVVEARYRLSQLYSRQNQNDKAVRELEAFLRDADPRTNASLVREARQMLERIRSGSAKK